MRHAFCFGVATDAASATDPVSLETVYKTVYKKLLTFLYKHPQCFFSWAFGGVELELYAKSHPEFIKLLSELVDRGQLELLGGGYYTPVLPLLLPVDRAGQIELLTTLQRKLVGRRPRGVGLSSNIWDPLLIDSYKSCVMDFAQLDVSLFPVHLPRFSPLILEHTGKTVAVLPVHSELAPRSESPESYIARLIQAYPQDNSPDMVAVCAVPPRDMLSLLETNWLERFCVALPEEIALDVPSRFLKEAGAFVPAYIPPGISYAGANQRNIQDYMQTHPCVQNVYSRMMHVSCTVNQCRGDKARKKAAREKLWEAQTGGAYLAADADTNSDFQTDAYRNCIQAEKLVREASGFSASALAFDFDSDGHTEYAYQLDAFNAFITKKGGAVFELDVFKALFNYCGDSLRLFVDCLQPAGTRTFDGETVLSRSLFTEVSFKRVKKEIRLQKTALYGTDRQCVLLKKNFSAFETGVQVQYILKNLSPAPLCAVFASSSSLLLPLGKGKQCKAEAVVEQQKLSLNTAKLFNAESGVATVRITDAADSASFVFVPNEEAGFAFKPLPAGQRTYAVSGTFFWKIALEPDREMEKTITLTILSPRKGEKET
jgi:hypothetical protein